MCALLAAALVPTPAGPASQRWRPRPSPAARRRAATSPASSCPARTVVCVNDKRGLRTFHRRVDRCPTMRARPHGGAERCTAWRRRCCQHIVWNRGCRRPNRHDGSARGRPTRESSPASWTASWQWARVAHKLDPCNGIVEAHPGVSEAAVRGGAGGQLRGQLRQRAGLCPPDAVAGGSDYGGAFRDATGELGRSPPSCSRR